MELSDIFARLGFPKHSDTIFTILEKLGSCTISEIAKKLHIHRPAVYRAIFMLMQQGLVVEKKMGKRRVYQAKPRTHINTLFSQEVRKVKQLETNSPELPIKNALGTVQLFEGSSAVAAIFNDVLTHSKRGDMFYRYTSEKDLDAVNQLLPNDYRKRRDNKRLERLVISNPESGGRKRNRLERFVKFLGSKKESFHQNAIQLIYGKRIAFIDLNTYKAFVIENETLADFQKTIFNALYSRL